MMRQKTKLPFAFHPDLNVQVTSMLLSVGFFGLRRQAPEFESSRPRSDPFSTSFAQILELPYEGSDLSMVIMLPREIEDDTTGLEKVGHKSDSNATRASRSATNHAAVPASAAGEGAHLREL